MTNGRKAVLLLGKSSTGFEEKQYSFQVKAVRLFTHTRRAFFYVEYKSKRNGIKEMKNRNRRREVVNDNKDDMLNKFIKYVAKQFGNPTGIGGLFSTFIMNCINKKQYDAAVKYLNIATNDTVLDIGFGNGYFIRRLLKNNPPKKIYGVEISNDMLNKVKKRCRKMILDDKLDLQIANVNHLPCQNGIMDKIYTINTFYFWDDINGSFSEIKRVLKQNGMFLNIIYSKEWLDKLIYTRYGFSKYSVEEIKRMTELNGLKVVNVVSIQHEKSYCIIAKNEQ
jgi:ubiquinone/menaquinone biosynthesis C-methylase UbiE